MTVYNVAYRNLPTEGYVGYEKMPEGTGYLVIKETVDRGLFELPDLYIRHIHAHDSAGNQLLVVSYTEREITSVERMRIAEGALAFLQGGGDARV
jgi:hypothetical protein